ncbi:MAG: hypothetical protein K2G89_03405 [Lachnospiraceae bacterium]|nr:hypothetical protein [Lachnospiraceae bacterium]
MALTTVYTCDICKQSKSKDDLAKITVKVSGLKVKGCSYGGFDIDICPDCLRKKGFVVEHKEEDEEQVEAQNRATLEDKLYDILESIGVVFEQ